VFGLNCILDAPQCQRFRPKLPSALPEVEVPKQPTPSTSTATTQQFTPPPPVSMSRNNEELERPPPPPPPRPEPADEFSELMFLLSPSMKTAIAEEISSYLSIEGEPPNDEELKLYVVNLLKPLLQRTVGVELLNRRKETEKEKEKVAQVVEVKDPFRHSMEPEQTALSQYQYAHSMDMRVNSVSGTRVVGTALPLLPSMGFRAVGGLELATVSGPGPSLFSPQGQQQQQDYRSYEWGGGGGGSGRRSPFSRREMAMNPVVERDRRF